MTCVIAVATSVAVGAVASVRQLRNKNVCVAMGVDRLRIKRHGPGEGAGYQDIPSGIKAHALAVGILRVTKLFGVEIAQVRSKLG